MADESHNFSTARVRLEEIVSQVRKKDTSLEKSLDLLEEGVRLANACTELIDRADWAAAGAAGTEGGEGADVMSEDATAADARDRDVAVDAEGAGVGDVGGDAAVASDDELSDSGAGEGEDPERNDDAGDLVGEDSALEYGLSADEGPA